MKALPGCPDFVIPAAKVAIFCDGDFWHGRNLRSRLLRLATGNNPDYWTAKIASNVKRDRKNRRALRAAGWCVLRYWETDILATPDVIATKIERVITREAARDHQKPKRNQSKKENR